MCYQPLASSFSRWTQTTRFSFSSSSLSRNAFLSIACNDQFVTTETVNYVLTCIWTIREHQWLTFQRCASLNYCNLLLLNIKFRHAYIPYTSQLFGWCEHIILLWPPRRPYGPWASPPLAIVCGASAWNSDTVFMLCQKRLWVVVDLKRHYRKSLNEWIILCLNHLLPPQQETSFKWVLIIVKHWTLANQNTCNQTLLLRHIVFGWCSFTVAS